MLQILLLQNLLLQIFLLQTVFLQLFLLRFRFPRRPFPHPLLPRVLP